MAKPAVFKRRPKPNPNEQLIKDMIDAGILSKYEQDFLGGFVLRGYVNNIKQASLWLKIKNNFLKFQATGVNPSRPVMPTEQLERLNELLAAKPNESACKFIESVREQGKKMSNAQNDKIYAIETEVYKL